MLPRALTIAGSDSGGGAGIQADLKTFTALGVYGMSAVTAVTVQTTEEVFGVHPLPPALVYDQICRVVDDIGTDIIKIGMLSNSAIVEAVAGALKRYPSIPVIVDPVMRAKGGTPLMDPGAEGVFRSLLAPMATVMTPNLSEAEALVGFPVHAPEDMERAADQLSVLGIPYLMIKGGHLEGDQVRDLVWHQGKLNWYVDQRIVTPHTHGTGCTLSSAIAALWARGLPPLEAMGEARRYVREAVRQAPGMGHGHGPLHHMWGQPRWI